MSAASRPGSRQFRWYLGGHAAWFTSFGIQMILFPWLVAVVLHESPQRVGIWTVSIRLTFARRYGPLWVIVSRRMRVRPWRMSE